MNIILGQSDLDIYLPENKTFPGGGALNLAYHWRQLGVPFTLLTRVADDRPHYFFEFYKRNDIPIMADSILIHGQSGSSDIHIRPDGEIYMDNWIEGVGAKIILGKGERKLVRQAEWLHAFLVPAVVDELKQLHALGQLATTQVSADFFDFDPFDLDAFHDIMSIIDMGFIGWQKELSDPTMRGIRGIVAELGKIVVVTLGSRGVMVYDGRQTATLSTQGNGLIEQFFPVEPVPVAGTTIGCGDAFAAYFLDAWQRTQDIVTAIEAGKQGGGKATAWKRCLPDLAYGR